MITKTEAENRLVAIGVGRRHARRALACGLAGAPLHIGNAHLYDEERVDALRSRADVAAAVVDEYADQGLFIARRDVDVRVPSDERLSVLAGGWRLGWPVHLWIGARAKRLGFFPLVATVAGFVTVGAEIVGITDDEHAASVPAQPVGGKSVPRSRLILRPARGWFAQFDQRRLRTGPGQPALVLGLVRHVDPLRPSRA